MSEVARRRLAVIGGATVKAIIAKDIAGSVEVVRDAYLAHAMGRSVNPRSAFLRPVGSTAERMIALPAYVESPEPAAGIKWIASYPGNRRRDLPRASAVVILNDCKSGFPIACLEGSVISAIRTVVSAMLAAESLLDGRREINAMGFIGTGLIARYFLLLLMKTGWMMRSLYLFDVDEGAQARFKVWATKQCPSSNIVEPGTAEQVLLMTDVSLFATVVSKPHIRAGVSLEGGGRIVLHLSLRDLPPEIIARSNNVVDDREHVLAEGTSVELAVRREGHSKFITCTLGDLLLGRRVPDNGRATIVSPFGLGILDVALARWVYARAVAEDNAVVLEDFFLAGDPYAW
jgi:2,3-diaminopropionate biosynthesis protein SbnB